MDLKGELQDYTKWLIEILPEGNLISISLVDAYFLENGKNTPVNLDASEIISKFEMDCGYALNQISYKNRMRKMVYLRCILANKLKWGTCLSHEQIGVIVGRNHSTITHYINTLYKNLMNDKSADDFHELVKITR